MILRKKILLWLLLAGLLCLLTGCGAEPEPVPEPEEEEPVPETVVTKVETEDPPEQEVLHMDVEIIYVDEVPEEPERDPKAEAQTKALQHLADELCSGGNGQWDIRIEDLNREVCASAQTESRPMISASLIKLFIMGCVYEQVEQGNLEHDAVYPLLVPMITVSDNDCANKLVRLLGDGDADVGMAKVNRWALMQGCGDTSMNRLMLADNGLQNYTTTADCAAVLRMIYEGTCVTEQWSAEMLELLQDQQVCNRIPAGLPETAVCGNKTGDLIGLCCADIAIILTEQADYILCAICDPGNDSAAANSIKELSADVYEVFCPET